MDEKKYVRSPKGFLAFCHDKEGKREMRGRAVEYFQRLGVFTFHDRFSEKIEVLGGKQQRFNVDDNQKQQNKQHSFNETAMTSSFDISALKDVLNGSGLNLTQNAFKDILTLIQEKKKSETLEKDETPWLEAVERWLDKGNFSKMTLRNYGRLIRDFEALIKERHEVSVVGDVTKDDARAYVAYLEEKYPGTNTRRMYFYAIQSFFSASAKYQKENVERNVESPFDGVREPKRGQRRVKKRHDALSKREVDLLMEKAHTEKTRVIIALMYFFALRKTEASRVRGEHLSLETDEDSRQYICLRGLRTKWHNPQRGVFKILGEDGCKERKVYQERCITILAPYAGTSGFLFPGKRGREYIDGKTPYNWIQKAAIAANLRVPESDELDPHRKIKSDVSPHWLRHACASNWRNAGASLETIAAFIGHSDPETTRHYIHADAEACRTIDY